MSEDRTNQQLSNLSVSYSDGHETEEAIREDVLLQTEKKMIELIDNVFNRKTDLLHLFPKRRKEKSCRVILLFDDLETTLVQDCMSVDALVRKLLSDYSEKKKRPRDNSGTCAICQDELSGPKYKRILGCGHEFHCTCIRESFIKSGSRCPMCRHNFFEDYAKDNMAYTPLEEFEDKCVIGSMTRWNS